MFQHCALSSYALTCALLKAERAAADPRQPARLEEHSAESRGAGKRAVREPSRSCASLRGWRSTVGNLIELLWLINTHHRPQLTGTCLKRRGVRFHRIRDLKQYNFNSIPPTSQSWVGARTPPSRLRQTASTLQGVLGMSARIPAGAAGFAAATATALRATPTSDSCLMDGDSTETRCRVAERVG